MLYVIFLEQLEPAALIKLKGNFLMSLHILLPFLPQMRLRLYLDIRLIV